jgi:hypothetical protein
MTIRGKLTPPPQTKSHLAQGLPELRPPRNEARPPATTGWTPKNPREKGPSTDRVVENAVNAAGGGSLQALRKLVGRVKTSEDVVDLIQSTLMDDAVAHMLATANKQGTWVEESIGGITLIAGPGESVALVKGQFRARLMEKADQMPGVERLPVTSNQAITSLVRDFGTTHGYSAETAALERLGWTVDTSSPPGVTSFTKGGYSLRFPDTGAGEDVRHFAPGEREKLAAAIRDGGDYTHPDVG